MKEFLNVNLNIGGFVIALISKEYQGNFEFNERYREFVTNEKQSIVLNILFGKMPLFNSWDFVFDSGGLWKMYKNDKRCGLNLYSSPSELLRSYAVIFTNNFRSGDIFLPNNHQVINSFPYTYPLAEVHMINLLSQGYGVLVHACAVKDGEKGLLFAGTSGAGKSTTAELWSTQSGATILSDDRVIIRKQNGEFWLYGTPWHGTSGLASPISVPLSRIYFLDHATENQLALLKSSDAYAKMLVRSFPTYWNAAGMEFTLGFLNELVQEIPCYNLGFVPDENVVDFIRCQNYA